MTKTAKNSDGIASMKVIRERQLSAVLTILYFVVESGRQQVVKGDDDSIRQAIGTPFGESFCNIANRIIPVALQPNFLHYLTHLVAKLRWDDAYNLPFTRVRR